jgi:hypothetical protein
VDYVTARKVFDSNDNQLINFFVGMCAGTELFCCKCEGKLLAEHARLKPPFVEDQDCRLKLTADIVQRLAALAAMAAQGQFNGKRFLAGDESTKLIVAAAIEHDFGIISNRANDRFLTIAELAGACGVLTLTTADVKQMI